MLVKAVIFVCAFVVAVCLANPQQGTQPPSSTTPASPTGQVFCGETPLNTFDCLENPKVINKDKVKKCGSGLSECDRIKCLFRESGWALPGDKVNKQKVAEYFNQYAVENPVWSAAVQHLKVACLDKALSPQGVNLNCEPYDVMHCIQTSFLRNAPASQWKTTHECAYPRSYTASCPICPTSCFATQVPYGSCNACLALPRTA